MKNLYDIAVIGESMAGKSTWIANLFQEDITKQLKSICELNQEGQTKIPVYYLLENPSKEIFKIKSIGWNLDLLTKTLIEKKYPKSVQRLIDLLNIPTGFTFETQENKEEEVGETIKDYLEGDRYKASVQALETTEFISTFVNDSILSEMRIISYVEVSGSANVDIWGVIQEYGLDGVKIRDTRGFLDETEEKMREYLGDKKQNISKENESIINNQAEEVDEKSEYLQELLDDRGIYGVDACVFMSVAGSNALSKKNSKSIYGPLIKDMLKKHPTALVVRTDRLTEIYAENPDISYEELISKDKEEKFVKIGRYFKGFNDLRALLSEYGLFERSENYRTDIARKHYKELLLADVLIGDTTEKEAEMMGRIYRKTVLGVFTGVLKGVQEYYKSIEQADRCLEALRGDQLEMLKKIYDKEFDSNIFMHGDAWGFANHKFTYVTKYLANKVQGSYYGGMVGVRGGLTTWITGHGRVGAAAIDFLETAYKVQKELYDKMVDVLEPEIELYVKQRYMDDVEITNAVKLMKQNLSLKYEREIEDNFERLSCTKRMIPRKYLMPAYENTRKDLGVSEKHIGKYLVELEDRFTGKRWNDDKYQMSVVKWFLWNLMFIRK